MNINWKVRIQNKQFWIALVPALMLLVSRVFSWFGIEVPTAVINSEALMFIELLFLLLAILGIVEDHTTKGVGDSQRALQYKKPAKDEHKTIGGK